MEWLGVASRRRVLGLLSLCRRMRTRIDLRGVYGKWAGLSGWRKPKLGYPDHHSGIHCFRGWTKGSCAKLVFKQKIELTFVKAVVLDQQFSNFFHCQRRSSRNGGLPKDRNFSGHLCPIEQK